MNKTAYLIAFIEQSTLRVVDAGIYSESAQSLTCNLGKVFPVDVIQFIREDYELAREATIKYATENIKWILPILDQ
jgi:hypothetical protein